MSEINRDTWVELYRRGFERGATGRDMKPEFVYEEMEPDNVAESDGELAALKAGYKEGQKNRTPGSSVDIEEQANSAYDRSEYSAGLDRWS